MVSAHPAFVTPGTLLALIVLLACESPYAARPADETPRPATPAAAEAPAADAPLGDGFVVWQSNRSGPWRIWIRGLDGSPPRQLTADEGGRGHCCAHVAPDGRGVAYVSLPTGQYLYPESGAAGELRFVRVDGGNERVLAGLARTYYEHRAAVWKNPREIIYIDGDGRTRLLDLGSGESQALTVEGQDAHGLLVNATLTHATSGLPTFSPYDAGARRVRNARVLGGCQPYFSHDGRWGFWIAGAGGPLRALDLATGQSTTVLDKGDPRLQAQGEYVYFPMLSPDGRLLAFAASGGKHDHFRADYDVYVAEVEPATLQIVGPVRRLTAEPSTDIYPDVWSAPLDLGRHFGEAPFTVELTPPPGDWRVTVDGAEIGRGRALRHAFERPGDYDVRATGGGKTLRGRVTVRPPRPPEVVRVDLRRGREVIVSFDEEVDAAGARFAFASGREIAAQRLTEDRRSVVLELAGDVTAADVLTVAGVRDRAQEPNVLAETRLDVAPPSWPADRRGLLFLWRTDDAANEVEVPESGALRTCLVTPQGRAVYDRHFAMVTAGGVFRVDDESAAAVLAGCQRTSELTVEATVTPAAKASGPGRILTFSSGDRARNFTLGLEGDHLVFRLRTRTTGPNADRPQLDLGPVPIGKPSHVSVTYTPGRLTAYANGREVFTTVEIQSGFHHWKPRALMVGNESQNVDRPFLGTVEGVAVYGRALDADEVAENHRRYAAELAARPAVPSWRVRGRLRARSPIPTLAQIAPYREALAVFEYDVVGGDLDAARVKVAHRVLLDGERTALTQRRAGEVYEMVVEPFLDQPQLEALFVSNAVGEDGRGYFDIASP